MLLGVILCSVGKNVSISCVKQVTKCNVLIEGVIESNGIPESYWIGSGVVISENGNIVTAKHCVEGATYVKVTLQDGQEFIVNKFFTDKNSDVAIIDIPGDGYSFATIGDSNALTKGNRVYHIGNPGGLWENTFFTGKVYKNHFRRIIFPNTEFLFLKMGVAGGCSGGGIYYDNKLVGIVSKGGDDFTLAVPSNVMKKVYDRYLLIQDFSNLLDYILQKDLLN
jgi:S1-C subfamily serine protease